ncbi:fungal-specific transcription factor domain-containing protein [Halteromyces radiatus]|uniref:fungal-specific transcription factor domain-containing protein n=1 Tax=Halteromyces radiatus TaxID=101107 RepID=UPI00221F3AD6|nr:fungal-specific transcription factor domain-containing protein [Halteromyces radiatus]KAI8088896.1 fungal-specific transcription factor domain-containing protein [Halteromyces radiatus]
MEVSPSSSPPSSSQDLGKRKRLPQACLVCRRKKTKCDGTKPTCNNCERLKQTCSYAASRRKREPRQKHIEILEKRVERMERLLRPGYNEGDSSNNSSLRDNDSLKSIRPKSTHFPPVVFRRTINNNDGQQLPPIHVGHNLNTTRHLHQVIDMDRRLLPPDMDDLVEIYLNRIYGVSPFFYRDDLSEKRSCPVVALMAIAAATAKYSDHPTQPLLWLSGEQYAEQIRRRMDDIVDMPSVTHVQVLMLLIMHEFGCARGTRSWMYCGIAGRMALELGLHKEPTDRLKDGEIISVETWKKNELRRNVFWGVYIFDRFGGASCARPVLFHDDDIDCHLPCNDDCLDQDIFYSESMDGTHITCYKVVERDDDGAATKVKFVETTSQNPKTRSRCNLGWPTHMIRIISLFAKVATFVNRTIPRSNTPLAPFDMNTDDYKILSEELDLWNRQLPFALQNTPANLERYRSEESRDTHRFLLSHILYNSLIVFLNRPALTLINNIKNMEELPTSHQEAIQLGVEKCLAASDNVSVMLTDINQHVKRVFPFLSYLTYSTATVVVHTIFTGKPLEAKKAAEALKAHCQFLQNLRKYYAMADRFFFMLRDFYGIHKTQLQIREDEQANKEKKNISSMETDLTAQIDSGSTDEGEQSTERASSSPNSQSALDDLVGSIDNTFSQLLDQQLDPSMSSMIPMYPNSMATDNRTSNFLTCSSYNTQQVPGVLPTTTSTELDYYAIWPFLDLDTNLSDRII